MPNLVVRVTDAEMAVVEAAARRAGQHKSEYVRRALALREQDGDLAERVSVIQDDHERRISRLEEMAGLSA